jgi:peroxiredoxin/glutaredoxin
MDFDLRSQTMKANMEGQRVPSVTFRTREGHQWVDVTSDELFDGRRVVVFSLPGAFTPTCSTSHVPRYDELEPVFREHGIDEIVCISVNDAFVMNEWRADQQAERIRFLPDGTGEFTSGMGMLVDRNDLGFGKRSWRYSMLVNDGIVERMFVEPEEPGDPFKVSDADTMLQAIAGDAVAPSGIAVLTRTGCEHCARAKALLDARGLRYEQLELRRDFRPAALRALTGASTYPQIFVDGNLVGGADDLEAWLDTRVAA